MRTSLDIPDPLFKAAKRLAVERETTLKQLVAQGLELVLRDNRARHPQTRTEPPSARLPKVRPAGDGQYAMTNAEIDAILAEEEAALYGHSG